MLVRVFVAFGSEYLVTRDARAEQFSNGITIISLYLNPLPGANAPPIEHSIFQVMKEASLLYCLPNNPFFYAGKGPSGDHAVQEATYACAFSHWLRIRIL